jgi:hypothetical protein
MKEMFVSVFYVLRFCNQASVLEDTKRVEWTGFQERDRRERSGRFAYLLACGPDAVVFDIFRFENGKTAIRCLESLD